MSTLKKAFLIIFALFWAIFIGWAVYKNHTTPSKTNNRGINTARTADNDTQKESQIEEMPVLARAFRIKKIDYKDILPVMGTIKSKSKIPLRFEIKGNIEKIYFDEGDIVQKGQTIANLTDKDARLRLEYANNKLASTNSKYKSLLKQLEIYQELFEADALIERKLEEIKFKVESAQADVKTAQTEKEIAQEDLKKTDLHAPKTGIMGPKSAEEGEFVTPQDEIGSLLDISELFLEIGIVERDLFKIKKEQRAEIIIDAYPKKVFEGYIDNISPIVEGKSRTSTVKIRIDNPEGLLNPGMFGRAEIFIKELDGAFLVPAISLIKIGQKRYLLPVVPKDAIQEEEGGIILGRVHLKNVNVGYISSEYAQIVGNLSGLKEGDLVITEVQGQLDNNTKVRVTGIEEYAQ